MRLIFKDSPCEYTQFKYFPEDNIFELSSPDESNKVVYHPILDLDNSFESNLFEFKILYNTQCTENKIFNVCVKSGIDEFTVGMIVPIQALFSKEHDFAEKNIFKKFAYKIINYLINILEDEGNRFTPFDGELHLEDFYSDIGECVMILDADCLVKVPNFCLDDYYPSLLKYGYTYIPTISNTRGNLPESNVILRKISPVIDNAQFRFLMKEQFPRVDCRYPAYEFLVYYQAIEIFISIIFDKEIKSLLATVNEDDFEALQLKEDLNQLISEKNRLKLLCEDYFTVDTDLKNTISQNCDLFLSDQEYADKSYYEKLYRVRCLLVHQFYNISEHQLQKLTKINDDFFFLIISISLSCHNRKPKGIAVES